MSRYGIAGFDTWRVHNPLDDAIDPSDSMYVEAEEVLRSENPDFEDSEGSILRQKLVDERARLIQDRYIENSRREARENGYE